MKMGEIHETLDKDTDQRSTNTYTNVNWRDRGPEAASAVAAVEERAGARARARTHEALDITVLLSGFSQARDGRHRPRPAGRRRTNIRGRQRREREGRRNLRAAETESETYLQTTGRSAGRPDTRSPAGSDGGGRGRQSTALG